MASCQEKGQILTLQANIENISSIGGCGWGFYRGLEFLFGNSPLSTEGFVVLDLVDDVDDCLGRIVDCTVRG